MDGPTSLDELRLRRLIDAGRSVVAERELERVFDRLLETARELTGARYAAIGVLDDSRQSLKDFITVGVDERVRLQIGDLPRGRGVLGMLISEPAPLRLDDVGRHPRSYGFPAAHPPMKSFLGVPILIRGEAWGNLYLTAKQDGPFDNADEEAAVVLAAWAAVAVENARLHREGEQRRVRLERSVRALEATVELERALAGETRLERILELIAKRTRALVEATGLAILLVDGDELSIAATAGVISHRIVGQRVTAESSVAGRVVASGRPERSRSLPDSLRFALGEFGVQATAGLFVPMLFRRSTLGVIEAFDRVGGPDFGDDDERILASVAVSAATAVATAQTVERDLVKRTLRAAEHERSRWARELHDETLQGLARLRVLLASGRRSDDLATLRSTIDDADEQLGVEIASLRSLITELRPTSLEDRPLRSSPQPPQ
jgi:GAF domain-containing protein